MGWLPTSKRIGYGQYEVDCGEERVFVTKTSRRKWVAQTKVDRYVFDSKSDAIAFAIEWLQEYA